MILLTALLLGLGGSIHCIGMCGPIALALPLTAKEKTIVVLQSLLYHFGRIVTYSIIGWILGFLGWGLALIGYQNVLSIVLGLVLIIAALFSLQLPIYKKLVLQQKSLSIWNNTIQKIQKWMSKYLKIRSYRSALMIGLLNGLLPCGLVYVALVGALSTSNYWLGGLYMFFFGLGTLPLMLSVMLFGKWSSRFLQKFQKLIPYSLFLLGTFLIYRGFLIEIPTNLSFWELMNNPPMCH